MNLCSNFHVPGFIVVGALLTQICSRKWTQTGGIVIVFANHNRHVQLKLTSPPSAQEEQHRARHCPDSKRMLCPSLLSAEIMKDSPCVDSRIPYRLPNGIFAAYQTRQKCVDP